MYEAYEALDISRRGRVLVITLANPPLNAVTTKMHAELARVFVDINRDPEAAVVVITGAGERAFSAGGDIDAMARRIENGQHDDWNRSITEAGEIVKGLLRLERPLIARINGHAMGLGATIAVLSDISFMMAGAKIADTHVKVGLAAGDGGALLWPLLMGFARARKYLFTGDALTGREAAELGLITDAAENIEQLDAMVFDLADRLANGATGAINATKSAVNLLLRNMIEGLIEAHLEHETETYLSDEHREAVTALRDKREPRFR